MEQSVFIYGSSAFVTYKFLFDRNVPEQTVYNNTSKSCKRPWLVIRHSVNRRLKLIAYNSISQGIIDQYKLPEFIELKAIAETQKEHIKKEKSGKVSVILKTILDIEYAGWETITDLYKNEFFDEEKLESFCRTHLVLSKIIELTELGYKLKDLYKAYIQYDGLVFETINYHSFCNKIRKIKKSDCLENELLHKLKNRESNNPKKSEDIIIEILNHYSNPKKLSGSQITKKINDYLLQLNRKPISPASVSSVIGQLEIQNKYMLSRYGKKYTEQHLLPKLRFDPPKSEGVIWFIDGTRFQFLYKTEKSKYNYLTYFIVLDGYKREIVGYSYDDTENSIMVLKALEKACVRTGYLPTEIISDNSSAYRQSDFLRKISNMRDWGVIWRNVKDPRDNSYVERCFGVIQSNFCKLYDGYLGDGITSKNIDGKPTQEELKKYLSNKNIRTKTELTALIEEIIEKYNISVREKYSENPDNIQDEPKERKIVMPIKLNMIKFGKLFWKQKVLQFNNWTISFIQNNKKLTYIARSNNKVMKYLRQQVIVRYDIKNPSFIMIFDLNTDEFICKISRYYNIPKASAEKTEKDNEALFYQANRKKQLNKRIIKNINEVKSKAEINRELLPPEISQIIPVSKSVQEESEADYMTNELINLVKDELKVFSVVGDESYEEKFKNLYKQIGDLKIFNHGKN